MPKSPSIYRLVVTPSSGPAGTAFTVAASATGRKPIYYSFRWKLSDKNIAGANSATFVATSPGDLTVNVTARNDWGSDSQISTSVVATPPLVAPANIDRPRIGGATQVGQSLKATSDGAWAGFPDPVLRRNWQRNGKNIPGAADVTYTVQDADAGASLRLKVTAANSEGSASATSAALIVPARAAAPAISSVDISPTSGAVGARFAVAVAVTGNPAATITRQWRLDGSDIAGATSASFTPTAAGDLTVQVTATNSQGSVTMESAAVAVGTGLKPPLSDSSPWNTEIPKNPAISTDSSTIVRKLIEWNSGQPTPFVAGVDGTNGDFNVPVYYAGSDNPLFAVDASQNDARSFQIQGARIRIPNAAAPAQGSDGHLVVVDENRQWVYEFAVVSDKPDGGGTLTCSYAGRTRYSGDGFDNASAYASKTAALAGRITTEEWIAAARGQIKDFGHAIAIMVKSTDGTSVWPAVGNAGGSDPTGAPKCGTWFQTTWTDEEINAMGIPAVAKAFVRTVCRYGMIVMDTTAGAGSWNVRSLGNDAADDAIHGARPLLAHVRAVGNTEDWHHSHDDVWYFGGVHSLDWENHLQVLDPGYMRNLYGAATAFKKLDPIATLTDSGPWTKTGGATIHACLADTALAPFAADAASRIGTTTVGRVAEARVEKLAIPEGRTLKAITLWWFGNTAAGSQYTGKLKSGTTVIGRYQMPAGQNYGWRAVSYPTDGSDVNLGDLRINFEFDAGASFCNIHGAHIMAELE